MRSRLLAALWWFSPNVLAVFSVVGFVMAMAAALAYTGFLHDIPTELDAKGATEQGLETLKRYGAQLRVSNVAFMAGALLFGVSALWWCLQRLVAGLRPRSAPARVAATRFCPRITWRVFAGALVMTVGVPLVGQAPMTPNQYIATNLQWKAMYPQLSRNDQGDLRLTGAVNRYLTMEAEQRLPEIGDAHSGRVILESHGGFMDEIPRLYDALRSHGVRRFAVARSCASACAMLWLLGPSREMTATASIGLHASLGVKDDWAPERGDPIVRAFLNALGVAPAAVDRAATTAHEGMAEFDIAAARAAQMLGDRAPPRTEAMVNAALRIIEAR